MIIIACRYVGMHVNMYVHMYVCGCNVSSYFTADPPSPLSPHSTIETALGACAPRACRLAAGCVRCAFAWLPRRGNLWAHKALFGLGRLAQSPKPTGAEWLSGTLVGTFVPPLLLGYCF